jgi:hypothetical protein
MLIRDLPEEARRELHAAVEAHGERWELIEGLTVEEFEDWMGARADDAKARAERNRRFLLILAELWELEDKAVQIAGNVESWKLEYFLHGEDRVRWQQLRREAEEMCTVPLVTRNRQPWHGAVEQELIRGLERKKGCATDQVVAAVVAAVLARDSSYPAEPARRYAEYFLEMPYLLETAVGEH